MVNRVAAPKLWDQVHFLAPAWKSPKEFVLYLYGIDLERGLSAGLIFIGIVVTHKENFFLQYSYGLHCLLMKESTEALEEVTMYVFIV